MAWAPAYRWATRPRARHTLTFLDAAPSVETSNDLSDVRFAMHTRGGLLLRISQVDYDDTGKAVMYSIEHHLPDWVRFTVERIGPGSAVND